MRLNPTVVVLKLAMSVSSSRGFSASQSNRSGFETGRVTGQEGGCRSLNPTVVVLKLASKRRCRERAVSLNPTVVVLKL